MIPFHDVTLADRPWMTRLIFEENSRSTDHCFANIYMWDDTYIQEVAEVEGCLCVRLNYHEAPFYSCPIGAGDKAEAVRHLKEDAKRLGVTLRIRGICQRDLAWLNEAFPDEFTVQEDRFVFDYLYRAEKLATLSGKKLQQKRNHIHRFEDACPDWRFQPMTEADITLCQAFQRYFGNPGDAVLLKDKERIVSAIYAIPLDGVWLPDGQKHPISLTYALATAPEFRGKGYGKTVMNTAIWRDFADKVEYSALWPAEDSLFPHYRAASSYVDAFSVREIIVSKPITDENPINIRAAQPGEYDAFRNHFLMERCSFFLSFGEKAIAFQKEVCHMSGGDCFLLGEKEPWGCAVCERESESRVAVKELLCPEDKTEKAIQQIAAVLPAEEYIVRMPAFLGESLGGEVRRCGQMQCRSGGIDFLKNGPGYYGLAFD